MASTTDFLPITDILDRVDDTFFQYYNAFYASFPVIRKENGAYVIAVFAFDTEKNYDEGMEGFYIQRPTAWLLTDLASGEILNVWDCRERDFTDFAYKVKARPDPDLPENPNAPWVKISKARSGKNPEFTEKTLNLFEDMRSEVLSGGKLDTEKNQIYFDNITEGLEQEFKMYYYDLCNNDDIKIEAHLFR